MAAFSVAVDGGADGIELDIHLSRDGVPVVIHDETVDRTTDGRGFVAAKRWSELQQLDAGSWFSKEFAGARIPALDEVLSAFGGRLRLNLELKEFRAGMAVLELLKQYPSADILISSFDYPLLQRLRATQASLPLAVLFDSGNWRHAVGLAAELAAHSFHPQSKRVNRPMIAACAQIGLPVFVWTVDRADLARSLIRIGVSGFFSNDSTSLRAAFDRQLPVELRGRLG